MNDILVCGGLFGGKQNEMACWQFGNPCLGAWGKAQARYEGSL